MIGLASMESSMVQELRTPTSQKGCIFVGTRTSPGLPSCTPRHASPMLCFSFTLFAPTYQRKRGSHSPRGRMSLALEAAWSRQEK